MTNKGWGEGEEDWESEDGWWGWGEKTKTLLEDGYGDHVLQNKNQYS